MNKFLSFVIVFCCACCINLAAQAKEKNSPKETKKEEKKVMQSEELVEVKKDQQVNPIIHMKTEKGEITIELYPQEAPGTVANFIDLVEKDFYNGLTFHRIISGFVVQGGCPVGNGTGGYEEKGKRRLIKLEKNNLKHDRPGRVAMARSSHPDSASSQFFIDLAPLPSLNAGGVDPYGYTIFGQVIEGMDVVNKIVKENIPPSPGSDGTANPVKMLSVSVAK